MLHFRLHGCLTDYWEWLLKKEKVFTEERALFLTVLILQITDIVTSYSQE